MQSENGGVVGMLEVIQSDFSRLEADTTAAETTAQKEYDEFMTSAKTDRAEKKTPIWNTRRTRKQSKRSSSPTRKTILMARKKSSMPLSLTMTSRTRACKAKTEEWLAC